MSGDISESSDNEEEVFDPKVRWVIPQRVECMSFVGRDVVAVAHDVYIAFINLRTGAEAVYVANSQETGDGVDVVAGHKGSMFAFAEKINHARIFLVMYPSFTVVTQFKDMDVFRYKGLCMMEGDLVAGFSGAPNYMVSVWSWRSSQRLLSVPTGVVRRQQIYTASRMHTLVCECWGEGLIVWEVAQCYRRCFMLKRAKAEVTGWEVSAPPLVAICWAADGALYALDPKGNLYGVTSDGVGMVTAVEWSQEDQITGTNKPCVCAFGNGLLVYGPDDKVRLLKKSEQSWRVTWMGALGVAGDPVLRLSTNAMSDMAVAWTHAGQVYRLVPDEDQPTIKLVAFKQRNIKRVQLLAPRYEHLVTLSEAGVLCVYELHSARLVTLKYIDGDDVWFSASPVETLLAVVGCVRTPVGSHPAAPLGHTTTVGRAAAEPNYGLALIRFDPEQGLSKVASTCLTHQIVSLVVFSPTGRELIAAAMSAGHVFVYKVSPEAHLTLTRYSELGRGLADCFLMKVGEVMRAFSLVLFSDKYAIGERIVCINAETGKDNKFAGKMQGPYAKLLPLSIKDTMLAVPHLSRQFHVLKLSGEKGITVSVKMGPIVESGHELRQFKGFRNVNALLTYGADGAIILRRPEGPPEYEWKLVASHRYEGGVAQAVVDARNRWVAHVSTLGTLAVTRACAPPGSAPPDPPLPLSPDPAMFDEVNQAIKIINHGDKNYLELQEEKKVREEALDYKKQRDEVVRTFGVLQRRLVALLEENIRERPLHQLSLSEFNLHLEAKKERLRQAEKEREEIRLHTEAKIRAQDKVTAWIKKTCWDAMLTPRVKLLAIFSHYQVENYPVLPTQRDLWPELQQTEALRSIEMENDADLFKPWEEICEALEPPPDSRRTGAGGGLTENSPSMGDLAREMRESQMLEMMETEEAPEGEPYVLSGSSAHKFITIPPFMIPQTLAFSYLQMNFLQHIVKLNVQNMRLWFNKQFDELMAQKRREVGLVAERNARLRFVIEELNKLSDLRLSFHHLMIVINDPQWAQDEEPHKLIKVEPEECSIPPYISPSQIVVVPPDPGPKDDFRERALNEMMDGVLEKLWHEEIKKPIPKPQCMLDKEPEHFNEEDLRQVFDYEAKVAFRNEERNKYRKMLHAEYAKLSQVLNDGVVKFNLKVKDLWLTKLQVDSVIGQENLNLMRMRRTNLDRLEMAERLEYLRGEVCSLEASLEVLQRELTQILEQSGECQSAYDALAQRDRHMDRTFKNNFADLSPIIVEQCYKFFKKRPKWHQRATMTPGTLNELAGGILAGVRPPLLHPDCFDYFKAVEQLDVISNMPAVMDEGLWTTMCRLRRAKIENEIRMRALVLETGYVDAGANVWNRAVGARRARLASTTQQIARHRDVVELTAINRTLQIVLPAGQVEIVTTGHMEDFDDATLIPREDIDTINNLILRVGAIKLRMMRKQMEFRKVILAKEWEHAQMKMKLRHMHEELYSYGRLRIPKELQLYLKNKEAGYTDEMDYQRLEKEMAATKMSFNRVLSDHMQRVEELEVKISSVEAATAMVEKLVMALNVKVSEKRLKEDPLEPIRIRRLLTNRMETLVARSQLVREVQANHSTIVLLQTELELLRLKTYPTLATFKTFC